MSEPYPTKTRIGLVDAIDERQVRHYHHEQPLTVRVGERGLDARTVTGRLAELVRAELATIPPAPPDDPGAWVLVELTQAGRRWRADARRTELPRESR